MLVSKVIAISAVRAKLMITAMVSLSRSPTKINYPSELVLMRKTNGKLPTLKAMPERIPENTSGKA